MIQQIRTYLRQKKLEILGRDTLEKVVMFYLYQKFFGVKLLNQIKMSFQDEERLAYWGYTNIPENKEAKELLKHVLGKKQIKPGMHYTDKPLLIAGIYLCAKKLSDEAATELLKSEILKKMKNFDYFEQFLLYTSLEMQYSNLSNINIKDENTTTLLGFYALNKVFPNSIDIDIKELTNIITDKLGLFISTESISSKEVFLLEFFLTNELKRAFKYKEYDGKSITRQILKCFNDSIVKIVKERRTGHPLFKINDEYDVQDLLFVVLKSLFPNLRPEDNTIKYGGTSKRIDIIIPSENIVIEAKMIQQGDNEKRFVEELKIDIANYHKYPNIRYLFGFVYDPYHRILHPDYFYELNGERSQQGVRYEVEIIINPR